MEVHSADLGRRPSRNAQFMLKPLFLGRGKTLSSQSSPALAIFLHTGETNDLND
jgi:hypothetical protein